MNLEKWVSYNEHGKLLRPWGTRFEVSNTRRHTDIPRTSELTLLSSVQLKVEDQLKGGRHDMIGSNWLVQAVILFYRKKKT